MPRKSSASNTSASDADASGPKTKYELTKPYGGMQGLMHSYGLKMWDDYDVQEAEVILDGFRKIDTAAAEGDKVDREQSATWKIKIASQKSSQSKIGRRRTIYTSCGKIGWSFIEKNQIFT
ncbi:hypothetical protein EDB85DRAFT_1218364 [Lactarius pseudohatsudake]|nr:hypothetical protein EDB85DRAFT_1218364 [Lactarius pseudohatsudake]